MPGLSCEDAKGLLAEAVRKHKSIESLAQCILFLCPEEVGYSDFIVEAIGHEWPDAIRRANSIIRKATGIQIRYNK